LLKRHVFKFTRCCCVFVGSSILIARMATRIAKPDGQHYVATGDVATFILDKAVKDLPGVGWAMTRKLDTMNIKTCRDLQAITLEKLQKDFGQKTGQSLHRFSRGQDNRPIKMEHERKSVSAEINYGIRFTQVIIHDSNASWKLILLLETA
jgi:DNA repair protein REV1